MKTWRAEIQVITKWLASSHARARNWTSVSWISILSLKHPVFIYLSCSHCPTWHTYLTEDGHCVSVLMRSGRGPLGWGSNMPGAQKWAQVKSFIGAVTWGKKGKFILSRGWKGNSLDKCKLKTYLEAGYGSWTFPGANCCNGMLNKSFLNLAVPQEHCLNNEVLMDKFSKALGRNWLLFNSNCNI